jgi:hypothetical protein
MEYENAMLRVTAEKMKNPLQLTADKMKTNYGERKRRDEDDSKDQQALIFARALMSVGGTFEFNNDCKKFGYSTIFQAMAGELHEQGASPMVKAKNAEDYENVYRNGCSRLNAKLIEDWSEFIIYAVPRNVNDKAIQVITINAGLVVNPDGNTAGQVHEERERKRVSGQMTASAKKLTRSVGQEKAIGVLTSIVQNIEQMTTLPQGKRMKELSESVE